MGHLGHSIDSTYGTEEEMTDTNSLVTARVRDTAPQMLKALENIMYLEVSPDLPAWLWEDIYNAYYAAKGIGGDEQKPVYVTTQQDVGGIVHRGG